MVKKQMQQERTPQESRVEMTQVVLPQHTNALGTAFGGQMISWIDICAAICAQKHCKSVAVTASFDSVHFINPVKLGYIVVLKSHINAAFKHSMEIETVVTAENPLDGEKMIAVRALSTFVAMNDMGKPKNVPSLHISSKEEKARHADAVRRREHRLAEKHQIEKDLVW